MDNRFQFRAWNGEAMEFGGFAIHASEGKVLIDAPGLTNVTEDSPVMQYTGLRDRNGVEIWESDIVRIDWQDSRYEQVVAVVKWGKSRAGWCFGSGIASEVHWSHEVIGNIHANPELLASHTTERGRVDEVSGIRLSVHRIF